MSWTPATIALHGAILVRGVWRFPYPTRMRPSWSRAQAGRKTRLVMEQVHPAGLYYEHSNWPSHSKGCLTALPGQRWRLHDQADGSRSDAEESRTPRTSVAVVTTIGPHGWRQGRLASTGLPARGSARVARLAPPGREDRPWEPRDAHAHSGRRRVSADYGTRAELSVLQSAPKAAVFVGSDFALSSRRSTPNASGRAGRASLVPEGATRSPLLGS